MEEKRVDRINQTQARTEELLDRIEQIQLSQSSNKEEIKVTRQCRKTIDKEAQATYITLFC